MKATISNHACVAALTQAAFSQKRITHVQMAVGLAIYLVEGGTTEKAKADLVSAYAAAGLDCADYTGSEYSTVRRKVGASSVLFKALGAEQITKWVGIEKNGRAISAIAEKLGELKLDSVERVLAYGGAAPTIRPKVVQLPAPSEPKHDRQAYLFEMETKHVHIHVDESATNDELREAVSKLQKLIRSRKEEKQAA